ncbi:MAG: thioester domain-containing protein [Solirubrobacterales bacterium]|nr:thioester domain-containing protein [Solirubrobacterales bacterium]
MSGTGYGQPVQGFIANFGNPFDPVTDGYPTTNPTEGFTPKDEGFAGIIYGTPVGGGPTLRLYCIDINTSTWGGIGYQLGTWDAAEVPNVGYVARLLNDYYPNTNEPAALTNLNQKAAAVQAAIWFFSDRYVLNTSMGALRDEVVAIVNAVIKAGPLIAPPPPSLTITPSSASGPNHVLGPFTVDTDHPPATVTVTDGTMYSNAAGTTLLGDGTTADVPSGQRIWLRSTGGASTAVLTATSEAIVPSGNVYLYDGNTAGVNDAQRLILAEKATLKTTVQATAEFLPFGSLVVKKTIAGPGAGSHGKVVIKVVCDDGVRRRPFVIPAGAHVGTTSRTYRRIEAGTTCTVTETSNGSTATTTVVVKGDGQKVAIPEGGKKTVKISDTYNFVPGSLLVRKTIAGPAAGKQGEIRIHTVCDGKALTPDFVIPAKSPAGEQTKQYDDIPVPAHCKVTETADGHSTAVSVVVEGSGQTVSVGPGEIAEADISDTYGLVPGQLEVTKTIAGSLAGHQGEVVIHTFCNGTALPDFVIPAGATGDQSHIYSGIPTPAKCTVTETVDGHTSTVSVDVIGSPDTVTIRPGGSAAAHITDTYGARPGSLLVTKTIAGPSAGHQGPITIHVVCDGTALSPDFVIAAHTPAGTVSHSFDDIPAGSVCTVTETTDGATATVIVTVSGDRQGVTVPAGKVASVSLMDVYDEGSPVEPEPEEPGSPAVDATGSLTVIKHITGPAARRHGPIAILVACGGPVEDFAFEIRARTGPGSVTRHFDNIPAGSHCNVKETANGHTNTVAVTASGSGRVTIPARGSATARLTDRFSVRVAPAPRPSVTG